MIPISSIDFESGIKISVMPSFTYAISEIDGDSGITEISGNVDELKAVRQAIYKVLKTERNRNIIYNNEYGVELSDLIGRSRVYVYSQLEERIKDALLRDIRIKEVYDFEFGLGKNKGEVYVNFKVRTNAGEDNIKMEVNI